VNLAGDKLFIATALIHNKLKVFEVKFSLRDF